MSHHVNKLLRSRRFLPLFATQFLGAFNDNFYRNAVLILFTFVLAQAQGFDSSAINNIAGGLFILPFFLFSATAGQLADKFDKARVIRVVKFFEIVAMSFATVGFIWGDSIFLLAVLFLMGAQSAFFGPLKYGILPDHLAEEELVEGNGLIEAATFIAILVGTIAGGLLIVADHGAYIVSAALVLLATLGWGVSFLIPHTKPAAPDLRINPNFIQETFSIVGRARQHRDVFLAILGISWFWLLGFVFTTQFAAYCKDVLGTDEVVVNFFLAVFSIGIAAGSMLCGRVLDGRITAQYVPLAALIMAVFSFDLYLASSGHQPGAEAITLPAFLANLWNWRIVIDLLMISVAGGFYIVPLYAIMQSRSDEKERARIIAANNILNALFMTAAALAAALLLFSGFSVIEIFLTTAIANILVAIVICRLLPQELMKTLVAAALRLFYKVEFEGWANVHKAGKRAVIVVNHVSFIDAALLAAFLPGKPLFAIDTHVAQRWWVKPFLGLVEAFPLDPTNPMATKSLIKAVRADRHLVIFPEGRITVTGSLMKVYEGPGMIADKADADVIPVQIHGAEQTHFSRLKGKYRRHLFPRIRISALAPRRLQVSESLRGRKRRHLIGNQLYDVMSDMAFETNNRPRTLFKALLEARDTHGGDVPIVEDMERKPLTYKRLVQGSLVLGEALSQESRRGDAVGVLLPSSSGTAVVFFALQAFGRVPALLNFSSGPGNLASACQTAGIKTVITSRRFLEVAKLKHLLDAFQGQEVMYLEDFRERIGLWQKLCGLFRAHAADRFHAKFKVAPDDPAVILFTSGSEGSPKGVVLSHRNILSNCHQMASRVDFSPTDLLFNALPTFHSFGLTAGMVLPIISGTRCFMYPSPLHYRVVPELVYATNATILFGTDTFLSGYARMAHPYDFYNMRYVFAGAERVRSETRQTWVDKFGLRILEGYGATECAPAIAVNTPMHYKAGTVGRLLPGIEHRLDYVPGVEDGVRLWVRGPNVMLGYYRAENPAVLDEPEDGWYDTGDIVSFDEEGFMTIKGRAKRFIKVAGEMVSLNAVENLIGKALPNSASAVIGMPDPRKGEQLVLVTERKDANREMIMAALREAGANELMIPKQVLVVERLPLLGSGKIDYPAVKSLVEERLSKPA